MASYKENNLFLPTSAKEMKALGWDYVDIVLFTGDARPSLYQESACLCSAGMQRSVSEPRQAASVDLCISELLLYLIRRLFYQ